MTYTDNFLRLTDTDISFSGERMRKAKNPFQISHWERDKIKIKYSQLIKDCMRMNLPKRLQD